MMFRILALALLVLTACSTIEAPGETETEVRTASQAGVSPGELSLPGHQSWLQQSMITRVQPAAPRLSTL
jgi:hypothetical protein